MASAATGDLPLHMISPAGLALVAGEGKWLLPPPHPNGYSHLELIDRTIVETVTTKHGRAIIQAPPRSGKSEITTRWGAAWMLGVHPDWRIILGTYAGNFAALWGRRVRDTLEECGKSLYGVRLRDDVSAANSWEIEVFRQGKWRVTGGGLHTVGAGGSVTGRGANVMLIDDPHKNAKEARSATMRESVWDWWTGTLRTRLEHPKSVLLIQTRWHHADLAGRLMKDDSEQWREIRLPALAESGDPLGRRPGTALWPSVQSVDELETTRKVSPYWFAAQYQQRPIPAEAGIFKEAHVRYYTVDVHGGQTFYVVGGNRWHHDDGVIITTVDLAISERDTADWNVAVTVWFHRKSETLLVLDVDRRRIEGAAHVEWLRQVWERWRPGFIGIEKVQFQAAVIKQAARAGLPARALKPDGDKVMRALPAAARMESGHLWFPAHAPWQADLVGELIEFPLGEHDDQVDALAYAVVESFGMGKARLKVY